MRPWDASNSLIKDLSLVMGMVRIPISPDMRHPLLLTNLRFVSLTSVAPLVMGMGTIPISPAP